MKSKSIPVGQYLIEGLEDSDDAIDYIHSLMPLIGEVVIWFNTLEAEIDYYLCESISDRSDQKGLIVINNLMYASKIELFSKFAREKIKAIDKNINFLNDLVNDLKECGSLRNRIVHANWLYTDNERYTLVKIKYAKNGLEHELWQFTPDSINSVINKIHVTRDALDHFIVEYS